MSISSYMEKISSRWSDIPEEHHASIKKRLRKKEKQNSGVVLNTPRTVYHGSNRRLKKVRAKPHYLADDKKVAFATPSKALAISFLAKWTDKDFYQGSTNGGPLTMKEKYPGAFEKIYKGKKGYIYSLDGKDFKWQPNLMRQERVSYNDPKVKSRKYIKDVWKALRQSDIKLVRHNGEVVQ